MEPQPFQAPASDQPAVSGRVRELSPRALELLEQARGPMLLVGVLLGLMGLLGLGNAASIATRYVPFLGQTLSLGVGLLTAVFGAVYMGLGLLLFGAALMVSQEDDDHGASVVLAVRLQLWFWRTIGATLLMVIALTVVLVVVGVIFGMSQV